MQMDISGILVKSLLVFYNYNSATSYGVKAFARPLSQQAVAIIMLLFVTKSKLRHTCTSWRPA
jgi:hypothetical protein